MYYDVPIFMILSIFTFFVLFVGFIVNLPDGLALLGELLLIFVT